MTTTTTTTFTDEPDPLTSLTLYDSSDTDNDSTCGPLSAAALREQKLRQTEEQFREQVGAWAVRDVFAEADERLAMKVPTTTRAGRTTDTEGGGVNSNNNDSHSGGDNRPPTWWKAKAEHEYYLRRYRDAKMAAEWALKVAEGGDAGEEIGETERRELRVLVGRCAERIEKEEGK